MRNRGKVSRWKKVLLILVAVLLVLKGWDMKMIHSEARNMERI